MKFKNLVQTLISSIAHATVTAGKWVISKLKVYLKPFANWKFLIAFGIAWMITNGWCYIFIGVGAWLKINWMWEVGSGYAAFLYFPFTVEKPITIAIAIFLQMKLFPKDEKLHQQLVEMQEEAKKDWENIKNKLKKR